MLNHAHQVINSVVGCCYEQLLL